MRIAHGIHHTHWDNIWYFTFEDAEIAFNYNFRQALRYFDEGRVSHFHLDGQTAALEVFLRDHPELEPRVAELVSSGALTVGPFETQLDAFICSGESVINNLRLGRKLGLRLGRVSDVAYLPDPFGHSIDYPKIFNQFGIHDFVLTRGVGGPYGLKNEFRWLGTDGSELVVHTLLAGYGYGTYAFREGTLFTEDALDYNKLGVAGLIDRLVENSALPDEFVFPLGFDQNPAIPDLADRIAEYNAADNGVEFRLTTWREFMDRVREHYDELQTFDRELYSTQYHRMHRSIFSARPDIKAVQDAAERELAFGTQPVMVLADHVGISFDRSLLDRWWTGLTRTQTHSSATMDDPSNAQIAQRAGDVHHAAASLTQYLMRRMAASMPGLPPGSVLVVNPLPWRRDLHVEAEVYTRTGRFTLTAGDRPVEFDVVEVHHDSNAVMRKDPNDRDPAGNYVRTTVRLQLPADPLSLQTLTVNDSPDEPGGTPWESGTEIGNDTLALRLTDDGWTLTVVATGEELTDFLRLEDSGDEGDNYDYSHPDHDWFLDFDWSNAEVRVQRATTVQRLRVTGSFEIPRTLREREHRHTSGWLEVDLTFELRAGDPLLRIHGGLTNHAENHRVRLLFASHEQHSTSLAGTQFSTIARPVDPPERANWRAESWFEEPSPQYPLLNHVALTGERTLTCYTRSAKEYEVTGDGYDDLAVVILRAVGHMGLPDLNRRPGRPSGLDYKVVDSPDSQLAGVRVDVDLAIAITAEQSSNAAFVQYAEFAGEPVVHTHQSFDKAARPILYFPVNPDDIDIPTAFGLGGFDRPLPFSTCTIEDDSGAVHLRVFNATDKPVRADFRFDPSVTAVDQVSLIGEVRSANIPAVSLRSGELTTISLQRRSKSWQR